MSLYFLIEDDTQHDKDGAVFIIDRDKACNFNSVQLKILMRIAQGDLYNFGVIKDAVKNELHLDLSDEEIKEDIT